MRNLGRSAESGRQVRIRRKLATPGPVRMPYLRGIQANFARSGLVVHQHGAGLVDQAPAACAESDREVDVVETSAIPL